MGVYESLFYNIGIDIYRAKRENEGDASLKGPESYVSGPE